MKEFDVIVIGARVAGAPTAMLLAQSGHRVLLVDRATFPSDTMSTHVVHAPGMAALHRWGLADRVVASGCPALERYRFDFGDFALVGRPRPVPGAAHAFAPQRIVLDALLVEAAAAAGVEVRQGFSVETLLVEDGAVRGIRGHTKDGAVVTERARVVVGADGVNSLVARTVEAPTYNAVPAVEAMYYAYWSDVAADPEFQIYIREDRGYALIPTNAGLTIVLVAWPIEQFAINKHDLEGTYRRSLETEPAVSDRIHGATRQSRILGARMDNFYRRPWGPGWALVGDAGYHKDACTAQGITDAFRDGEAVADALGDVFSGRATFEAAMTRYQETRDLVTAPIYDLTCQLASFDPPPEDVQELLFALQYSAEGMDDLMSAIAGTMPVDAFFHPDNLARYLAGAAQVGATVEADPIR